MPPHQFKSIRHNNNSKRTSSAVPSAAASNPTTQHLKIDAIKPNSSPSSSATPAVLVKAYFFVASLSSSSTDNKKSSRNKDVNNFSFVHTKRHQHDRSASANNKLAEQEDEEESAASIERLNSKNGEALTTVFRWNPHQQNNNTNNDNNNNIAGSTTSKNLFLPSGQPVNNSNNNNVTDHNNNNNNNNNTPLFHGAWTSLQTLFEPLDANLVTDDEVDRKDEFLRYLTWDAMSLDNPQVVAAPSSIPIAQQPKDLKNNKMLQQKGCSHRNKRAENYKHSDDDNTDDDNPSLKVTIPSTTTPSSSTATSLYSSFATDIDDATNANSNFRHKSQLQIYQEAVLSKTRALLSKMLPTLAHGSVVICSPLGKFSLDHLTQPTKVKDFIEGSCCVAVFLSEYLFRTKILEPFSKSLLELKKIRNLASMRVRRNQSSSNKQNGQSEDGSEWGDKNSKNDDDDAADDDDLQDFTAQIFRSADVTALDIIQYSDDTVRIAESGAECQRVIPPLIQRDISRRRRENLRRYDEEDRARVETVAARGAMRTEMVLAQRDDDKLRQEQLKRSSMMSHNGNYYNNNNYDDADPHSSSSFLHHQRQNNNVSAALVGAHRYYEHTQRDFREKLSLAAASLVPRFKPELNNQRTLFESQLFGGAVPVHFSKHVNVNNLGNANSENNKNNDAKNTNSPSDAQRFLESRSSENKTLDDDEQKQNKKHDAASSNYEPKTITASYFQERQLRSQQNGTSSGGGGNNGNNNQIVALLSRPLTREEKIGIKLKATIASLDEECHRDVEGAALEVAEALASRLQRRRKLRENAAVEQGVVDTLKGKERTRHRLAIERAAVAAMRDLVRETGEDMQGRVPMKIKVVDGVVVSVPID